jgi:hypothetical protein
VAATALYLAADATFTTGAELLVGGGNVDVRCDVEPLVGPAALRRALEIENARDAPPQSTRSGHRRLRSYVDVRFDYADHYFVLSPLRGQSLVTQNEQATALTVGDVVLVDGARPLQFFAQNNSKGPWRNLAINLPRRELTAHLGFEPQGGCVRRSGTPAGRLLLELIHSANEAALSESLAADSYMQLVVYDLVGALFAPSDQSAGSRHTDKCSTASGALSGRAMPIQTWVHWRWPLGQESRSVICRNCSRSAVRPALK